MSEHSTPTQLPLQFEDATIEIPLTQGFVALISAEDSDLALVKWFAHKSLSGHVYAYRNQYKPKQWMMKMHRVILARMLGRDLTSKELVDHINGNGQDNRRSNLRLATYSQNRVNTKLSKDNKSGFKGVRSYRKRWVAEIRFNGKTTHLGVFDTPEEASEVYKKAAIELHGEFVRFE